MVSVGIQSDSGTRCHGGGGDGGGAQQRHKSSPTTICVDTATQTGQSASRSDHSIQVLGETNIPKGPSNMLRRHGR